MLTPGPGRASSGARDPSCIGPPRKRPQTTASACSESFLRSPRCPGECGVKTFLSFYIVWFTSLTFLPFLVDPTIGHSVRETGTCVVSPVLGSYSRIFSVWAVARVWSQKTIL